jgi:glycosyltransferase involved in cell wall biosynthesis
MKILQCHNHYQRPGGEDQVFEDERRLLEQHGHEVIRYTRHNDEITADGRIMAALRTVWNQQTYRELKALIADRRPDIIHFTNTFPLISPAAYYAAAAANTPAVQSLHNYRLICPGSLLMRDGKVCTKCVGRRFAWPAAQHGCYRNSRMGSAVISTMLATHRHLGTWSRKIDCYIALTEFSRKTFVDAGLPEAKVVVKPNFVAPDPGMGTGDGDFAMFAGRLDAAKGITTMLTAWQRVGQQLPLVIVGDGPLAPAVREAASDNAAVRFLGPQPVSQVLELMGQAKLLVLPSLWFEGFPKTIVEAFSRGLPVICSRLGSMQQVVDDGRTGLHFTPGAAEELVAGVLGLLEQPERRAAMRLAARQEYLMHYTAEINYQQLLAIYEQVLADRQRLTTVDAPLGQSLDPVG